MLPVSFTPHDFGHIDSPEFSKMEWLLPQEKLELIVGFFKRPKQELRNQQELQTYCFEIVLKACLKNKYYKVIAASEHLFGLLDKNGRSVYQAIIEDERDTKLALNFLECIEKTKQLQESLTYNDLSLSLHYAARGNRSDLFSKVSNEYWNTVNSESKTPLHLAVEAGAKEFLIELLKNPCSLDLRYKDKETQLIFSVFSLAVYKGEIECFDLLVGVLKARGVEDNKYFRQIIPNVGNFLH